MRELRLIDAFRLSDEVFESKKNNPHSDGIVRRTHDHEHEHFLRMIDLTPTIDAVPVVRCKDCKHSAEESYSGAFLCSRKMFGLVRSTDFCSFGERKDGDANE